MPQSKRSAGEDRLKLIDDQSHQWCARCLDYRLATEFRYHGDYWCKTCTRAYHNARYNPRQRQDLDLRKNYGITVDQYEAMLTAQGGVCAVCGRPETHPHTRGQDRPCYLAVDHDHVTGEVRALLCKECNTALGSLHDDPARIQALLVYAERIQQDRAA